MGGKSLIDGLYGITEEVYIEDGEGLVAILKNPTTGHVYLFGEALDNGTWSSRFFADFLPESVVKENPDQKALPANKNFSSGGLICSVPGCALHRIYAPLPNGQYGGPDVKKYTCMFAVKVDSSDVMRLDEISYKNSQDGVKRKFHYLKAISGSKKGQHSPVGPFNCHTYIANVLYHAGFSEASDFVYDMENNERKVRKFLLKRPHRERPGYRVS